MHLCSMENRQPFYQNHTYHVFNRGNGVESIYRCEANYAYFLKKYHLAMDPFWETHAWCLAPDQFHFIITVKPLPMIPADLTRAISRTFGDFCNGYVQAFNRHHNRKGSLLRRAYKRCAVNSNTDLTNLTCYLHNFPVKEALVKSPDRWPYSSYREYMFAPEDKFASDPLLKCFGSQEEFLRMHKIQLGKRTLDIPYIPAA